jgi:prepilin-type processing-associated H-X9-DG protein
MRKKAFTSIQTVVLLVVVGTTVALLAPIFIQSRESVRPTGCATNLKQIGLGILQYTLDYDDKFPLVKVGKVGWSEAIQPYSKGWQIFQCPNEATPLSGKTPSTDYFYNAQLAGSQRQRKLGISNVLMGGDGLPSHRTNSSLTSFPSHWLTDSKSPAYRHEGAANYLYVDGRVQSIDAEDLTAEIFR